MGPAGSPQSCSMPNPRAPALLWGPGQVGKELLEVPWLWQRLCGQAGCTARAPCHGDMALPQLLQGGCTLSPGAPLLLVPPARLQPRQAARGMPPQPPAPKQPPRLGPCQENEETVTALPPAHTQTPQPLPVPHNVPAPPQLPARPGAVPSCPWRGLQVPLLGQRSWFSIGAGGCSPCHRPPVPLGCARSLWRCHSGRSARPVRHCSPRTGSKALAPRLVAFPGRPRAGDAAGREQGERGGAVLTRAGRDIAGLGLQLGALAGFPSVPRGHAPPRPGPGPSPAGHRAQAPRGPLLPRAVNCNTAQRRHGTAPQGAAASPAPPSWHQRGPWAAQTPRARGRGSAAGLGMVPTPLLALRRRHLPHLHAPKAPSRHRWCWRSPWHSLFRPGTAPARVALTSSARSGSTRGSQAS